MASSSETAATIAKEQELTSYDGENDPPRSEPSTPEIPQLAETASPVSNPKPDVSDQDYQQLLPKLLSHFNNNREELARGLGLHRSTVDRWLNGKSRPNNSTVLRMRRLAQERDIK